MPVRAPFSPVCRPQACSTPPHTAPGLDKRAAAKIKGDLTYDFSEHSDFHPQSNLPPRRLPLRTLRQHAISTDSPYHPARKGGNNEPDNLITLCSKCHGAAHGCIPEGWTMTAEDVEQACVEYVSDMYAGDWYPLE
ncbi:MAG: HNH endonuclease [Oscillospiraceae bacterium]